jgi:ubiquinone/menaquinone biosynthesis C-methylase UbiE
MWKFQDAFFDPLVDLGEIENTAFAGVFSPKPEIGQKRVGVNATFLENAEEYYRKHQGFEYWKGLFAAAFTKMAIKDAPLIVEYGCGFGNSTLPILEIMPTSQIIASDISPNLAAIGRRLISDRGFADRCMFVAMDAQKAYLKENIADLVTGSAILHHLAEPELLIAAAMRVLKPSKCAIFFEPFELGYAIIRMLCLDICAEAARRSVTSPMIEWLRQLAEALNLQIARERNPGWRDLDDKWVFPRNALQTIADKVGAELIVYPIDGGAGKFRAHLVYMIVNYVNLAVSDLPDWAWAIVDRIDNDIFSPASMPDVLLSGCVIFRKR